MYTLAMADDHELFRRGLKDLFNSSGNFQIVAEAVNGEDLILQLKQLSTLPDVCIIDVSMPILNGYETMSMINKYWPDLKVMALSMYSDDLCIVNMIRNGARGYILKGSPSAEIENAIIATIKNGYYHSGIDSILLSALIQNKKNGSLDLSNNELKFLELACSDLNYSEIANTMSISPRTVDGYRDGLFKKFNVRKRTALAIIAMRMGLVPGQLSINN